MVASSIKVSSCRKPAGKRLVFQSAKLGVLAFLQVAPLNVGKARFGERRTQCRFVVDEGMPPVAHEIVHDEGRVIGGNDLR